jgi:tRNA wybutosine-synthesizing protein 1
VYNDIFYIVYVGVPGVKPERLEEGMTVRHCALSLVGTVLIYS